MGRRLEEAFKAVMSRGYSATTVVCLCALTFIVGCLVQQLPGLPDVSTGVSLLLALIAALISSS